VNESNKTANLVNFDVDSNRDHFVIRDIGMFSPGVAATGKSTATYSVKPLAAGTSTATITDEAGKTLAVPIAVR